MPPRPRRLDMGTPPEPIPASSSFNSLSRPVKSAGGAGNWAGVRGRGAGVGGRGGGVGAGGGGREGWVGGRRWGRGGRGVVIGASLEREGAGERGRRRASCSEQVA